MARYRFTREDRSKAGKVVKTRTPPAACPRCGKDMSGRAWHSYLGHLGLHSLADRFFNGDIEVAQKRLRENGIARSDPYPQNGAFKSYRSVTKD